VFRRDLAAGFDAGEVKVTSTHTKPLVSHILSHRLVHAARRNAFGGGVEVVKAREGRKVGEGKHERYDE
jgi:hypothetical protein